MLKLFNLTWRNAFAILAGLALFALIFLFSFVLPAFLEYEARGDTGSQDMEVTLMVYTMISAMLFYFAIRHNIWFKKNDFVGDMCAVAIGTNCLIWCMGFIMSLPS